MLFTKEICLSFLREYSQHVTKDCFAFSRVDNVFYNETYAVCIREHCAERNFRKCFC